MIEYRRRLLLAAALIAIVAAIFFLETVSGRSSGTKKAVDLAPRPGSASEKAAYYEPAKELAGIEGYINADEGLRLNDLIGKKVLLIDFWTYSCINCQRTLPYLRSWHEKYEDEGLEIIGVHTPEFSFEEKMENVQRAVAEWDIPYPVVLDNAYATWRAYGNRYWPQKYLIDIDGFIVYEHVGEGAYEETERQIQRALAERKQVLGEGGSVSSGVANPADAEAVDFSRRMSPEIYFGSSLNSRLGGGEPYAEGIQRLSVPANPYRDIFYLDGSWEFHKEFAENKDPGGRIVLRFKAGKVFFVAGAAEETRIKVLLDGRPLSAHRGAQVNESSEVRVREAGLYRIVEGLDGESEHTLELIVERPGLQAYTFTFGS